MSLKHHFILIACLVVFIFTSCEKSNTNKSNATARVILAGMDGADFPVLFDGNRKIELETNGRKGFTPNSIYVTGNDIYLTTMQGGYWKNGKWVDLYTLCEKADQNTRLSRIVIKGQDVYVLGLKQLGNGVDTVRVWKNGKIVHQRKTNSSILDLFNVDDLGAIYYPVQQIISQGGTFGNFWSNTASYIYKNDSEVITTYTSVSGNNPVTSLNFFGIVFEGLNIYTLEYKFGYNSPYAQPVSGSLNWRKNFSTTYMNSYNTRNPVVFAPKGFTVYKDSTYMTGMDEQQYVKGIFCKNGVEKLLFDMPAAIAGHVGNVVVKNGDVYIAGRDNINSNTVYWKNFVPVTSSFKFKCHLISVL